MSELRFGSYRIAGTIGSGGLSTIYEAVHDPLGDLREPSARGSPGVGRIVAIKALKTQIAPASSFGEQLEREATVLADLVHPNVVLLLDAGRSPSGRPYLVLEHVDGPSLHDLVAPPAAGAPPRGRSAKKRRLPVPAALAAAHGICAALEHVHERGIVHRDLKPSNVLVARSGAVKLIDFGIAQRPRTASVSDTLGTEGITATGLLAPEPLKDAFGTPAYMSPEQILGDFVDGRSDLFSLGVVLYELLGGARPFEAEDRADAKPSAAQRIRRDAPLPLRERAPEVPRAVERIVMRLLEKAPSERYPSAGAVKERIESALRAETREEPGAILRAALAEMGFGPSGGATGPVSGRAAARGGPRSTRRASLSLPRVLMGLSAITATFTLAAIANESPRARGREGGSAGGAALELAPEGAGGLRVVATPWAHVRVDGQLIETTPFARAIPLGPGTHWVTLSHPDAPTPIEREITIATGETVTLDVTMKLSAEDAGRDAE